MKEVYGLSDMINQFQKEISYYSQMEAYGVTPYEKNYHQGLIQERTQELIKQIERYVVAAQQMNQEPEELRNFTLEELAYFDGKEGRPAYVAVNGNVYDLSEKVRWAGGTHFGLLAGNDLTAQFVGCHLGLTSMLEQLPLVGILVIGETQ